MKAKYAVVARGLGSCKDNILADEEKDDEGGEVTGNYASDDFRIL